MSQEDRSERTREHEERRAEREAERAARRAERHADRGLRFGGWSFGFRDLGGSKQFTVESPGAATADTEERRFSVTAAPRLRVSNVSGGIRVTVGDPGEVFVRARKSVQGWSQERSRRLLENVEIRMEQHGDEIVVEPRLFQQERSWQELLRGGRLSVDFEIRVPREARIESRTVSGETSIRGTRGPVEVQSVSGEVSIADVQGPLRLRTVSGDATVSSFAGAVEANSVSGDLGFEHCRARVGEIVSVSGDIDVDALALADEGGRIKTVSGDVELTLLPGDAVIHFSSLSGDAEVETPARVEKQGRRDRLITVGAGGPSLRVRTVSGDLTVRGGEGVDPVVADVAETAPLTPSSPEPHTTAREILERLARGEIGVDEAAAELDASGDR